MIFIPSLILALLTIISRQVTNSWFSPSSFFVLSWFFFVSMPLLCAPEYRVNIYGLWFIVTFIIAFCSGSIFSSFFNLEIRKNIISNVNHRRLLHPFILINFITFIGIVALILYVELRYNTSIIYNWFSIPNLISIDRYNDDLSYPIFVKYSLFFIYPGSLISGIILNSPQFTKKLKIFCFLPLIFASISSIIQGSRTSIILSAVVLFSSFLSYRIIIYNGKLKVSILRSLLNFFFVSVIFLFFFIFIQWLRQGLDPIIFDLLTIKLKAYLFGYLSAFTNWFVDSEIAYSSESFFSTFAGPLNLLGLIERPLGFYGAAEISTNITTNIFTAWRSIVSDFSVVGSLIISFWFGSFMQFEYQKQKKHEFDGFLILSIFYAFTLYSPLISIFHYNSIIFSWLIVYAILKIQYLK